MTEYALSSEQVEAIVILGECNYLPHEIVQSFADQDLPISEDQVNRALITGVTERG